MRAASGREYYPPKGAQGLPHARNPTPTTSQGVNTYEVIGSHPRDKDAERKLFVAFKWLPEYSEVTMATSKPMCWSCQQGWWDWMGNNPLVKFSFMDLDTRWVLSAAGRVSSVVGAQAAASGRNHH